MAFVKIQKNNKTLTVSASAFKNNYSRNGWELDEVEEVKEKVAEPIQKDEWDEVEEEEVTEEKSVDEMSMDELKAKAKALNINVKQYNTVGALRKAIKKAIADV